MSPTGRGTDQAETPSKRPRATKGGKEHAGRHKARFVLKVKLPNFRRTPATEEGATLRWMETTASTTDETMSGGERQNVGADCSADGSVFIFSHTPTSKAPGDGDKVKLSVLRAISKMLQENQLIRERLAALSQAK